MNINLYDLLIEENLKKEERDKLKSELSLYLFSIPSVIFLNNISFNGI